MKAEQNYQPRLSTYVGQFREGDEGGLDLGQVLATLRRRAFLIIAITSGVAVLAALKALNDPPIYQGQFEILIEPSTVEKQVISSTNPETLSNPQEVVNVKDEAVLKILKSSGLLSPVVQDLQPLFPQIDYGNLWNTLNISTAGQNLQIITVTYQNSDKELVKSVLEKVSQAYLDYSRTALRTGVSRGITFVENQLPQLRSRVNAQQLKLQKIRQQNNLVNPETRGQELSTLLGTVGQQQLENRMQLQEAKALYSFLQQDLAQQGAESAAVPALNENSRYQALLNQLQEIDSQIAKDSVLLFEESPEIRILKNQRQNLLPLIRQEGQRVLRETAGRIRALETRDRILNETIGRLNQQMKQLSGVLREYTEVQRELEIATTNLNEFLSKREALRIDAAQKEIPWRLLAPPGEPIPKTASLKRNIALGTILGMLLGIGAALALDKFSDQLYTAKEVKGVTPLPIIGTIPFEKKLAEFTPAEDESGLIFSLVNYHLTLSNGYGSKEYGVSGFFEAFRSLYTNLRFLKEGSQVSSLVITSAMPAEGKSTVAVYLAQAAAALGQRVLLVDADLRHPSLQDRLKLTGEKGLTDLLFLEALEFNSVIQRLPLEENLFVLTAGSGSPDAARLLASQKMQNLMEQLQATFDLVIYKAPSLIGLADTHLLASRTDGVLLVMSLGKLRRSDLEEALNELKLSGTQILGMVTNYVREGQTSYLVRGKT
jgi:capsular exopolysaccharide synthesis family protein